MGNLADAIWEKISSYNLFNYLFTGAIFLIGSDQIAQTQFINLPVAAFILLAYFIGMVLSRIGSLIIEPMFKKTGFVKFAAYSDFLKAEKSDTKIPALLEVNNTYRTFIAVFAALAAMKIGVATKDRFPPVALFMEWAWPVALTVLFAFAYRKQTKFIHDRVEHCAKTAGPKHG